MDILVILGKIGFDWQVALANTANFLLIAFLLARFAFKPLKKAIRARQLVIQEGLENAKKAQTELMMAGAQGQQVLNDAKIEAQRVMEAAALKKEQMVIAARQKAQKEALDILEDAKNQGDIQIEAMRQKFREEGIELVIASAEKIIGEKFDTGHNKKYISTLLTNES